MTAVESSAIPAMTADKGDGTAVADLAMTDDCRVGHVSTVEDAAGGGHDEFTGEAGRG